MLERCGEFWKKDMELIGILAGESMVKTGFVIPIWSYVVHFWNNVHQIVKNVIA